MAGIQSSRDCFPADNLAIVDNNIALCEKSVREEPENEIARDYLYEAYQQKADLLAQMTERGARADEHPHAILSGVIVTGRRQALLVPGLLLLGSAAASADTHRAAFQSGSSSRCHHPQSERHVTVRAWTKSEVMVVANARHRPGGSGRRANRQSSGRSSLASLRHRISPDDLRADYEISVPEDAELQIHDDSGGVNVSNVLGDMNVETIAADVDMEDAAGYLTVKTVGGSFQCLRCAGRLEVSSISGNFKLDRPAQHYVRAQTSEGNILFNGQFLPNATYRPEKLQWRDRSALFARAIRLI